MAKITKQNTAENQLHIEYWPTAPIIVNGIKAFDFYHAFYAQTNNTNKR